MVDERRDATCRVTREAGEARAPLVGLLVVPAEEVLHEGSLAEGLHTAHQAAKGA